jgi:endoglucanase
MRKDQTLTVETMHGTRRGEVSAARRRSLRRILLSTVAALTLVPVAAVSGASPAGAATAQFKGMNWARLGDNFTTGTHVLDGLSSSDSYSTVKAKANAIYSGMASTGVNAVRLPINTQDAGTSWWNAYRGTIDAATSLGFKVILTYWEDGASSGGKVTNTSAFTTMWNTVVAAYGSNNQVYFEPMNEPHGYSSADWRNFAASWISSHSSVPKGRILVGGTGYSQDLRDLCSDSRFSGTLFSYHYYAFFYGTKTYNQWLSDFDTRLGSCAARAVMTEYGAEMDSGLNYNDANATDNFVRYLRAVTERERALGMGGVYWPAIGGKITSGKNWDHYSMYSRSGSGTNQTLTVRNSSGANRVRYGWGL